MPVGAGTRARRSTATVCGLSGMGGILSSGPWHDPPDLRVLVLVREPEVPGPLPDPGLLRVRPWCAGDHDPLDPQAFEDPAPLAVGVGDERLRQRRPPGVILRVQL